MKHLEVQPQARQVERLPYDGKTVREQRRYIKLLENLVIVLIVLLTIAGSYALAQAGIWAAALLG